MYFRNRQYSGRGNFKASALPYRCIRRDNRYSRPALYTWKRRYEQYVEHDNSVSEVKFVRTWNNDKKEDVRFIRNNYEDNFEIDQDYVARKPFYQFRHFRNFGYSGPHFYRWKSIPPNEELLDEGLDSYISRMKYEFPWNNENGKTTYFSNIGSIRGQSSGAHEMNPIWPPFNFGNSFRYSQPPLYKWKRQVPSKNQLDYEIDKYMSQIKFKRSWDRENGNMVMNCKNNESEEDSNVGVRGSVSPSRSSSSNDDSRPSVCRWGRVVPSRRQMDYQIDDYMSRNKLKRSWDQENEKVDFDFTNDNPKMNSNVGVREFSTPFRRFGNHRDSQQGWYGCKRRLLHKEQLDRDRDYCRFEVKRSRNNDLRNERQNMHYGNYARHSGNHWNSGNFPLRCIENGFRENRPYWHKRFKRNVPSKEQLDDELDCCMRQAKLKRMWDSEENNGNVFQFCNNRQNFPFGRQSSYEWDRRLLAKEELDDDIDRYMSEVKFKSLMNRNYENVIDDELFLEEYKNDTKKSLKLKETFRF